MYEVEIITADGEARYDFPTEQEAVKAYASFLLEIRQGTELNLHDLDNSKTILSYQEKEVESE